MYFFTMCMLLMDLPNMFMSKLCLCVVLLDKWLNRRENMKTQPLSEPTDAEAKQEEVAEEEKSNPYTLEKIKNYW